jgi:DNA-binding NarL/FixJ family response regulator
MSPSLSPGSVDESQSVYTVVLADDSRLLRESMEKTMKVIFPSCRVVGEASDGEGALELCLRLKPDVLITDLRLPKKNGILLIHELKALLPGTSVIVHTGSESATMLSLARDAHPAAILHSDDGLTGLRKAFEAATTGELYVSKAVLERIKRHAAEVVSLTPTELAVLSCLVRSQQTKGIAATINKSERTVAAHRESIYKKTGTHDMPGLLVWAMRNGLVE